MITHTETRRSPYPPADLFAMVANVERYPEFLPWVSEVHVLSRGEKEMLAKMVVRFSGISAGYTSRVLLTPARDGEEAAISVQLVEGPFKHLRNEWRFAPHPEGGSTIHFEIDFAFESRLLQKLIGGMFEKAARKMVAAFEKRADTLFSPSSSGRGLG